MGRPFLVPGWTSWEILQRVLDSSYVEMINQYKETKYKAIGSFHCYPTLMIYRHDTVEYGMDFPS